MVVLEKLGPTWRRAKADACQENDNNGGILDGGEHKGEGRVG
jgi:hypothetical protein